MAVAMSIKARDVSSLKRAIVEFTFSGTYTTGGEQPTSPATGVRRNLGFTEVLIVHMESGAVPGQPALGVVAKYDITTDKVLLFRADQIDDTLEELPNATAIANIVLRAEIVGR